MQELLSSLKIDELTKYHPLGHTMHMQEGRQQPRYKTLATVRIPRLLEGENVLKDLSITGCCVECTAYAEIKPATVYHLVIHPESISHIGSFELVVESRWVRSSGYSGEVGFNIIASPKGREFMRYVDYLAYRSSL